MKDTGNQYSCSRRSSRTGPDVPVEQGGALRDRTEFGRSSGSRKISVLPAFLTLLLAASLVAQKTPKSTSQVRSPNGDEDKGNHRRSEITAKRLRERDRSFAGKEWHGLRRRLLVPEVLFRRHGYGLQQGRRDHAHRLESETGRSGIRPRAGSGEGKQHLRPPRRERRPGLELKTLKKSQR